MKKIKELSKKIEYLGKILIRTKSSLIFKADSLKKQGLEEQAKLLYSEIAPIEWDLAQYTKKFGENYCSEGLSAVSCYTLCGNYKKARELCNELIKEDFPKKYKKELSKTLKWIDKKEADNT